jgi:hypothetical protein
MPGNCFPKYVKVEPVRVSITTYLKLKLSSIC